MEVLKAKYSAWRTKKEEREKQEAIERLSSSEMVNKLLENNRESLIKYLIFTLVLTVSYQINFAIQDK